MLSRPGLSALLAALVLGPFLPLRGSAQPGTGVHTLLDSLIVEIEEVNPSVLAARLDADAHRARGVRQAAWPDPSASVAVLPLPVLTARGPQRSQWRVEQMVPYPGTRTLTRRISERDARASSERADAVEADAVLALKQAVYDLLRLQAQTRWLDEFQDLLESFEDAAATQYAVGRGSQGAVLRAQLEHHTLGRMRLQYAREHRRGLANLARLLNRPDLDSLALPGAPFPSAILDALLEGAASPDPDRALQLARSARPEFRALRETLAGDALEIDLARAEGRPDFGVSLTYTDIRRDDALPLGTGRDALAVGAGLKIPLNRGRVRAGVREAEVRRSQTETRLEALSADVEAEVRDLIEQLAYLLEERNLIEGLLIPQAEVTLEASRSAYTTGRTGFLDLLDAERSLFSLRLDHVAVGARYLQTRAALERAIGIRWLEGEALLNEPDDR